MGFPETFSQGWLMSSNIRHKLFVLLLNQVSIFLYSASDRGCVYQSGSMAMKEKLLRGGLNTALDPSTTQMFVKVYDTYF